MAEASSMAAAVTRVLAALPGDDRCLVRSLVLVELLARRGIDSTLVVGTGKPPRFTAHVWVELEGCPSVGCPSVAAGEHATGRLAEL
jgi:hypothetical protein